MKIEFHEKQIVALNALAIDSDIKQVLYGGGVVFITLCYWLRTQSIKVVF